jgi:replicative DNA helicase
MEIIECGLIGALLGDKNKVSAVYDIVQPADFKDPRCGIVFQAIIDISKKGGTPDLVSVFSALGKKVDAVWLSGLTDMAAGSPTMAALEISTRAKRDRVVNRLKIAVSENMPLDLLVEELASIAAEANAKGNDNSCKMSDVVERFADLIKNNQAADEYGIDTGYMFLENKYIRYMPGHVWVIGGATSTGKTAVMVDMLCRVLDGLKKRKIAVFSTEMMEEQNVARFLARQTGYHSNLILSGKLRDGWDEVSSSLAWFAEQEIYLFDNIYQFQDMEMKLRQLSMTGKIDIVYLDYVQNMTYKGATTEYEKTEKMAKGVQRLAKQLKCTFVCLSQISNAAAKDHDQPMTFKGGGEWGAVADLGVWLKRNKKNKELLCFDFQKNRHGQTGVQILQFVNNYVRLKEVYHEENQ